MRGNRRANYRVFRDEMNQLVLEDLGPWEEHPTITNDAEAVVADVAGRLRGRRLFYYDSEGDLTELLIKDGRFDGFKHARAKDIA